MLIGLLFKEKLPKVTSSALRILCVGYFPSEDLPCAIGQYLLLSGRVPLDPELL